MMLELLYGIWSESRDIFLAAPKLKDEEEFVLSGLKFLLQYRKIFAKGVEKCLTSRWGTRLLDTSSKRDWLFSMEE